MKKIKYLTGLLLVSLVLFLLPTNVLANEQKIVDNASLFTEQEIQSLNSQIKIAIQETQMDGLILTTNTTNGESIQVFGADYYENNGYGIGFGEADNRDGFIFIIDMESREFDILSTGSTEALLKDGRGSDIIDETEDSMIDGDYYEAASIAIEQVVRYHKVGMPRDIYYDTATGSVKKEKRITLIEFLIAALIAGVVAAISFFSIIKTYTLKKSSYSYAYQSNGHLNLTTQQDQHVDTNITRVRIPKSSSGGGSGGSFNSSSGRSFGSGGGGKF